jgi:hypothetical protein
LLIRHKDESTLPAKSCRLLAVRSNL